MVDKPRLKRVTPAPPPDGFPTFMAWVRVATERRGMPAELARYCDVERQNAEKWRKKRSLPKGPALRRSIAEWAQVPYEAVRELIERDEAQRIAASKEEAGKPVAPRRKQNPAARLAR